MKVLFFRFWIGYERLANSEMLILVDKFPTKIGGMQLIKNGII